MYAFRVVLVALLLTLAFALTGIPAFADAVYHSEHIALAPVGDNLLRTGFVENIHADGPIVYAHENYVLNGAKPNSEFDVYLMIYPNDTSCSGENLPFNTATLVTNKAGNGKAQGIFPPSAVEGLHGATVSGRWELRSNDAVMHKTECSVIVLD